MPADKKAITGSGFCPKQRQLQLLAIRIFLKPKSITESPASTSTADAFALAVHGISEWSDDILPLNQAAKLLGVGAQTLKRQAKRGTFRLVQNADDQPGVSKPEALKLAERNRSRLLGWSRLVDVCKELSLHRNIGESVCKAAGEPPSLDLCGHHRISSENEQRLRERSQEWQSRASWVRKVDFAQSVNEDPRLVDVVVRKLNQPIDRDPQGFAILSQEACQAFNAWRERRDARRMPVYEFESQPYYAVDAVAVDAASNMTTQDSPACKQLAERYYRRVLFWISSGSLKARHLLGKHYLAAPERQAVLDDLPLTEASRCAGVAVSTIKEWVAKGKLEATRHLGNRRSLSRSQFYRFVTQQYRESPKLRKRPCVPLWVLGQLHEHAETLGLKGVESLSKALCQEGPFQSSLEDTIAEGTGSVPIQAWHLLNQWLDSVAEGEIPKALGHYQSMPASRVLTLIDVLAAREAFPDREVLLDCCSTLDRTDRARFKSKLLNSGTLFSGAIPTFLHMASHRDRLKLYLPGERFAVGDMIMHLEAYDFGIVTDLSEQGTMTVDWRSSGPLVMRYHLPDS